jgi:hypothetical protein
MRFPARHADKWTDDAGEQKSYPQFVPNVTRPCSGNELVSSRNFPAEMQGDFLVNNVIGTLGTLHYKVRQQAAGYVGEYVGNLIECADRNFRPVDLQFGPDGALYICDWHNALIGHLQHNLRDPNRDHAHGRIWRVHFTKRPLVNPVVIAGNSIPRLLDLLAEPEERTRYRLRRELAARDTSDVLEALAPFVQRQAEAKNERALLEALWLHQSHDVLDEALLRKLLSAEDFRVRAAATRAIIQWRAQLSDSLALVAQQIVDVHPQVRVEAIRAASFFDGDQALEVALEALNHPTDDPYISYTLDQTMRTLEATE